MAEEDERLRSEWVIVLALSRLKRSTERKPNMKKIKSLTFSDPNTKTQKQEEEKGLVDNGEIGVSAETPFCLSPPSFFSLRLQWHQAAPLSSPGL